MDSTRRQLELVLPRPRSEAKHAARMVRVDASGTIDRLISWNLSKVLAEGDNITAVTSLLVTPTGPALSVSDFFRSRVITRLNGTINKNENYRLQFVATTQSGDTFLAVGFLSTQITSGPWPVQFTEVGLQTIAGDALQTIDGSSLVKVTA